MIQAAGTYFDALGTEVEQHQQAMVERLSTDIATANGGANDLTGILYQITDDSSIYTATGGAGAVVDGGGAPLTFNMLDKAIDAASDIGVGGGAVNTIVATRPVARMLKSLISAQIQYVGQQTIAAGFEVTTYNGIAIVQDNIWKDNTKILFFDRNRATLLVHKDFTYEELAKTRDSVDFMIKWYGGFILEGAASLLRNFTLTAGI
jgi:hypothetical protein